MAQEISSLSFLFFWLFGSCTLECSRIFLNILSISKNLYFFFFKLLDLKTFLDFLFYFFRLWIVETSKISRVFQNLPKYNWMFVLLTSRNWLNIPEKFFLWRTIEIYRTELHCLEVTGFQMVQEISKVKTWVFFLNL